VVLGLGVWRSILDETLTMSSQLDFVIEGFHGYVSKPP
jgi:hypothetical protein